MNQLMPPRPMLWRPHWTVTLFYWLPDTALHKIKIFKKVSLLTSMYLFLTSDFVYCGSLGESAILGCKFAPKDKLSAKRLCSTDASTPLKLLHAFLNAVQFPEIKSQQLNITQHFSRTSCLFCFHLCLFPVRHHLEWYGPIQITLSQIETPNELFGLKVHICTPHVGVKWCLKASLAFSPEHCWTVL